LTAPSGERVHAQVTSLGGGEYRVEWTPRTAGGSHTCGWL